MFVPLYPVFDGATNQHLLLLGQSIWPHAPVESHPSSWSEGGCEISSVAVNSPKIHVQHVFALWWRGWRQWLSLSRMFRAASLSAINKRTSQKNVIEIFNARMAKMTNF